jgi:hypothetical protein
MELLPTQINDLLALIDASSFDRREFEIDQASGLPVIRFKGSPTGIWCAIKNLGTHEPRVEARPGEHAMNEEHKARDWQDVCRRVQRWLLCLRRELDAAARAGAPDARVPAWALAELPPEYAVITQRLAELQEQERRLRRMAGLLWETGEPLNRLVRDTFRSAGLNAETTRPGMTYDVSVDLEGGRRLLVEVTGIEGQINKGSKKIAQVLSARQTEAKAGDRVGIVVNAHREKPIPEREASTVITDDALNLLEGLDAVVVTSTDLFRVWKLSLSNPDAARNELQQLHGAAAGLVRLLHRL